MGSPKPPTPVKLIAGLLASSDTLLAETVALLQEHWGQIDSASATTEWNATDYYRDELGAVVRRCFVGFTQLVSADELAEVKLRTNELEDRWRIAAGRQVNIDPGYIAATKLVLASTKDAAHRISVGRGIFAEVTLLFSNGMFRPHAFTYPDYATPETMAFFGGVRARYLAQLRGVT